MKRSDTVWQSEELARQFLTGMRGAIPLADTQIAVMLQLLDTGRPVRRCLDLGCGDGVLGAAVLTQYPKATGVFVDRPDKSANILAPVETQCRWLRRIGFVEVDCYFKHFELAVFGGRRR